METKGVKILKNVKTCWISMFFLFNVLWQNNNFVDEDDL
jgi:hypothetical protein